MASEGRANGSASSAERHDEHQYLDLVSKIMVEGNDKGDRTGTGTRHAAQCSLFTINQSLP